MRFLIEFKCTERFYYTAALSVFVWSLSAKVLVTILFWFEKRITKCTEFNDLLQMWGYSPLTHGALKSLTATCYYYFVMCCTMLVKIMWYQINHELAFRYIITVQQIKYDFFTLMKLINLYCYVCEQERSFIFCKLKYVK